MNNWQTILLLEVLDSDFSQKALEKIWLNISNRVLFLLVDMQTSGCDVFAITQSMYLTRKPQALIGSNVFQLHFCIIFYLTKTIFFFFFQQVLLRHKCFLRINEKLEEAPELWSTLSYKILMSESNADKFTPFKHNLTFCQPFSTYLESQQMENLLGQWGIKNGPSPV